MKPGKKFKTEEILLRAAEALLERGGPAAVTTRAVCDAAKVKAPTLYHHFGDKDGLLNAVAEKGLEAFLNKKQASPETDDALNDLISGWESFIGFVLERPQLFRLITQRFGKNREILAAVMAKTDGRLTRLADQGRLATDVDFGSRALLALSNGVTALWTQGASQSQIKAVGNFLLKATLSALVVA